MTALVSFHEAAEVELNEAAQYYESEVRGLGKAFLTEAIVLSNRFEIILKPHPLFLRS